MSRKFVNGLSHETKTQVDTEQNLNAVSKAQHYIDSHVQRNLSNFLQAPKIIQNRGEGTVALDFRMDSNTLKNNGISFLSHLHPEYHSVKVQSVVLEAADRTTPAYHYFAEILQNEINTQLTPTNSNPNALILPVKVDIQTHYSSIIGSTLAQKPIVAHIRLKFGKHDLHIH